MYQCNEFTIDLQRFELRCRGEIRRVEPRVFDLIRYLIENRGRVVSKDELLDAVWKGRIVSESTLNSCINAARRALADSGRTQKVILTVPRRGFRFVAKVNRIGAPGTDSVEWSRRTEASNAISGAAMTLEGRPTVAVLPFVNLEGVTSQEYLAEGLAGDVIAGLSHNKWIGVISRSSSFFHRSRPVDLPKISNDLHAGYVVDGGIRRKNDRLRIYVELIDVNSSQCLWSERYDLATGHVFETEDEMTHQVVAAITSEVMTAQIRSALRKEDWDLDAWDILMRAHWHLWRLNQQHSEDVKRLLLKVREIDPNISQGYSDMALCHVFDALFGWGPSREDSAQKALREARHSLNLDPNDAWGHTALGFVDHLYGQHDAALQRFHDAIDLNASLANAYGHAAMTFGFLGKCDDVERNMNIALKLSPHDPLKPFWLNAKAMGLFIAGEYESAARVAEETVRANPDYPGGLRVLAASYGELGRTKKAEKAVERLIRAMPNVSLRKTSDQLPFSEEGDRRRYLRGLRKAGLRE